MSKYIFRTLLALLVLAIMSWANPLASRVEAHPHSKQGHDHSHTHGGSRSSHTHQHNHDHRDNHNHKHDGDKDKDDDVDPDDTATCNASTGICSNRATVTVVGMKKIISVSSGSGAVLLDVTSPRVYLRSKSGDLVARGLTRFGYIITRIGNISLKYCVKPQESYTSLVYVVITDSAPGVDEDGDPNSSDANLQFMTGSRMKIPIRMSTGSKMKIPIPRTARLYKSDFESTHSSFEIYESVTKGNLFISEFNPAVPPILDCPY